MEWTWDAPLGSGYGRYKQVGEGFVSEACAECCYRRFPILDLLSFKSGVLLG